MTLAAWSQLGKVRKLIRIEEMLDPTFESYKQNDILEKQFGKKQLLYVAINPDTPFTYGNICQLQNWLHDRDLNDHAIHSTLSVFDLRRPLREGDRLWYPKLQSDACTRPPTDVYINPVLDTPWLGFLSDRKGRDLLIEVGFNPLKHGPLGNFNKGGIDAFLAGLNNLLGKHHIAAKVYLTGSAAFEWFLAHGMERDQRINLYCLLMVIVLFRLFFGSLKGSLLLCLTLIISGSWVFGLIGFLGIEVDILLNSLFIMLIVSSVQDFLFLSLAQIRTPEFTLENIRPYLLPCFLTSFTTMVGFATLNMSELKVIRQFGLLAATGAGFEFAAIFFFLPAVFVLVPRLRIWTNAKRAFLFRWLEKPASYTPGKLLMAILLGGMVWSVFEVQRLRITDAPKDGFPKDHPLHLSTNYFAQSRDWETSASVIFKPEVKDADRQSMLAALGARNHNIARVFGLDDVEAYLTRGFSPLTADLIKREFKFSSAIAAYQSPDKWSRSYVFLKETSLDHVAQLKHDVDSVCADAQCFLAGSLAVYLDFSGKIIPTLFDSFATSLLLISLFIVLLCWDLGRLSAAVPVILSSFWGVFIMVGIYSVFGISVNYVSCIFAAVLVGMAGDNAIYFLLGARTREFDKSVAYYGSGALGVTLLMMAFALMFRFSEFQNPRTLGSLFCTGFLAVLIGDLWVLKGFVAMNSMLLRWWQRLFSSKQ